MILAEKFLIMIKMIGKKYFYNLDDDEGNIHEFPEDTVNQKVNSHVNSINNTNNYFLSNTNNINSLKNKHNNYNYKFRSYEPNKKTQPTKLQYNININNTNKRNNIFNQNNDIQKMNPKTDIENKKRNRKMYTSVNKVFLEIINKNLLKYKKLVMLKKMN